MINGMPTAIVTSFHVFMGFPLNGASSMHAIAHSHDDAFIPSNTRPRSTRRGCRS